MVREGLERLDDVGFISPYPSVETATFELNSRNGRWIDPEVLRSQFRQMRIGASLRGIEATVQGMLELRNGKLVLRFSPNDAPLPITPLTQKVQLDHRTGNARAPTREEAEAYTRLQNAEPGAFVQIAGPIRQNSGETVIEARIFRTFSDADAKLDSCLLSIESNDPYGLSEHYSSIRDALLQMDEVAEASEHHTNNVCRVRLRPGRWPDQKRFAEIIERLRIGARMIELRVIVDGWLEHSGGRSQLRLNNVEFELASSTEQVKRLAAQWTGAPRPVRVLGSIDSANAPSGPKRLNAVVIELDLNRWNDIIGTACNTSGRTESAELHPNPEDKLAPGQPETLNAQFEAGVLRLSWIPNLERDLSGYNIYRARQDNEERVQVAAGVTKHFYELYCGAGGENYWYWVTALDATGNESLPSEPVLATGP